MCARLGCFSVSLRSWSIRRSAVLLLLAVLFPRDDAHGAGPRLPGNARCAERSHFSTKLIQLAALRVTAPARNACAVDVTAVATTWARVDGSLHILDGFLATRLERLEKLSPRLHEAMNHVRAGELPVYIGTPTQIAAYHASTRVLGDRLTREERIAEMAAVLESADSDRFLFGVVRIDMERVASRRTGAAFDAEVDAILIHEVWGHLVPVAENPIRSSMCRDPRPGEPALESCAMRRENDLRQELGLSPRKHYPL
jgi:hypothetical protein